MRGSRTDVATGHGPIESRSRTPESRPNFATAAWPPRSVLTAPILSPSDASFQVQPTVVPAVARSSPIRLLAVTHNLSWEGAPLIQLDLHSRLREKGTIDPVVLSAEAGPLLSRYEHIRSTSRWHLSSATDACPPSVDGEHVKQLARWIRAAAVRARPRQHRPDVLGDGRGAAGRRARRLEHSRK